MKFLCDRCKTRYSIADERVRGKILKIRCKNCSAVISVREGMDEPAEWAAPAPAAPSAPSPVPSAPMRPPPASLHEEWYVSLDGNQEGPFLLPEAQAWVAAKSPDDELHCWCEGFDDWLPVEKVSHFRGLRGRVTRARTPTRPGVETTPEPKPLFAATLAAIEADAEKEKEKSSEKPAVPAPAPVPAAAPLPAVAAKPGAGTGSLPRLSPAATKTTPITGAAKLPAPGVLKPATPAIPKSATPAIGVPKAASPAISDVAAAAPPLPAPPRAGAGLPPVQQLSGPTGPGAPIGTPAPAIPRPAPMFDTGPEEAPASGGNGASVSAMDDIADAPTRHDPVDDMDDDLSIGEVSRVVRLSDVAKALPPKKPAASPAATAAVAAAIARGTGMVAKIEPLVPTGAGATTEGAQSVYQSVVSQPPRKRTLLYVGAGVVAIALAAVVLIVATSGAGAGDDDQIASTTRNYDDLGGTVDNPLVRRPGLGKQVEGLADGGVGPGSTGRRPTGSGGRPTGSGTNSGSQTSSGSDTGPTTIGPDGQPLRPLSPDDVFAMSTKMEIGTRRCYERALKDDPFLKVTKIKATITVNKAGTVSNVSLSSMQGTPLATCLTAAIGRWRFRASTEGIVSEFSIVFEQR